MCHVASDFAFPLFLEILRVDLLVLQPVGEGYNSTKENSVILYLVHKGADINKPDLYGCPPLHFAAMRGNEVATMEILSCRKTNIECADKQNMTALHLAATHNEKQVIQMLIERGADLRKRDEDDSTPLHYACQEGNLEVVDMIFQAAAKKDNWATVNKMVKDRDSAQNTALHLAVESQVYEVVELVISRGSDVNMPRANYQLPLHIAAGEGNLEIVKLLIEHSAKIDACDVNQETPLYKAAAHNHFEVVRHLIDRGAAINRHDKDNFSPLLIAACNGHAETIELLLDKSSDILFDHDKNDKTALFWTAEEDHMDALQVLLNHPRSRDLIDEPDRYENSPLHIACQKGYHNIVKALIEHGADVDAKNEEEQTPLQLAARSGRTMVVRELTKRDKTLINDEDEDSNTALHHAALTGHMRTAEALLQAGANIECRNCLLWTPLDCAADRGWLKTCRLLLENDAPVDPMDKTKTTPLHLACIKGHVKVVQLLLKWNANVAQRDVDGNNCLDLAITHNNKDVALCLVNSEKWKIMMMNENLDLEKGVRVTPMRKLITKMPDVAEAVFNNCMKASCKNTDDVNYKITFNYEFLDDMYSNWRLSDIGSDAMSTAQSVYDEDDKLVEDAKPYSNDTTVLKTNHPLMMMVKANQEDLLAHPLVTSLLYHKWNMFGRYVYYTNLIIYCIFLLFLTGYIIVIKPPYMYRKEINYQKNSSCERLRDLDLTAAKPTFAEIAKWVIIVLACCNIVRELFQLFNARWQYFGWENLIEWVTYITAVLLVFDFTKCQQETGVRLDWQWQLGTISIFLAWMDLVLFFRKFPRFGIYVVMVSDILVTFLSFFPVLLLFIIAFALSFFTLLQNQVEFTSVPFGMLKASVMMIGELEFGDLFLDNTDEHEGQVYYKGVSYALFATFLIIMTILIMNLLVGLAVDDIKAVQDQAVLKRLAMQVELALDVEAVLPQYFRRKFIRKSISVTPNSAKRLFQRIFGASSSLLSPSAIAKALDPELDELEKIQEGQALLKSQIGSLRNEIQTIQENNSQLMNMMTTLLRHHALEVSHNDLTVE